MQRSSKEKINNVRDNGENFSGLYKK